ncbi:FtsK/SpoIIIE domain-containing protein [Corynebacterium amycolatum]|uniref:FtsK/SpoIIIE domain-containing protein n=1 Tax=Corynebacterium amycolatum TaxID=43765 RepID=UPI0038D13EAF
MAKDFFAGLGDSDLPQVTGDMEQAAETDSIDEGFCDPELIDEAVADLAAYRGKYSQLAQHVEGGTFHEPGVGKLPADSVRELLRVYGAVFSPQPWHDHVVRFEPDSVGLTLELDQGDAVEALRSAGFYDVTGTGLTAQVAGHDMQATRGYQLVKRDARGLWELVQATTLAHWNHTMHKLGLAYVTKRADGVTNYLCPTPQGWGVTGDGRGYLVVKTPPTVGFDVWNRTVEKLRGVVKCDVELRRLAADRVAIVTPPRAARMTPWVPSADEQLHVTGTKSLEDFYASAVAAYPRLSWVQGRTADGEVLSAAMARSPHALVGGGTGSGKSFWASWLLTSCVLAGADVLIADGKGSSDYVPLVQHLPNVAMYTSTDAEHVRLIQWVHAEMEQRYAQQKAAAISGEVYEPRPLVVLFDEYGAFSKSINDKSHPQNAGWAGVQAKLTNVLQKARAVRIHVLFVAQTLYAETFPGDMKGNIQARLSLGVPEAYTLGVVAGDAAETAKELSAAIPRGTPGQGIAMSSLPSGEVTAQRVAAPYGYVPGRLEAEKNPDVRKVWRTVERVYKTIPCVTPRLAPMFDAAVEPTGRKKGEELPPRWQDYTCDELAQLPWVRVTASELAGKPLPWAAEYDVLSASYRGHEARVTGDEHVTYH